eukprot:TRINITY_DN16209_c0_g4_i1.p1 TRINITY_DN16209_c0_g4~~TRINITY_DN16209_c0_g4_i1.p1  ORF type:complete len:1132 (-),score=314.87 TRINITY_DN16209_c0_g4_i1:32-3427(-)
MRLSWRSSALLALLIKLLDVRSVEGLRIADDAAGELSGEEAAELVDPTPELLALKAKLVALLQNDTGSESPIPAASAVSSLNAAAGVSAAAAAAEQQSVAAVQQQTSVAAGAAPQAALVGADTAKVAPPGAPPQGMALGTPPPLRVPRDTISKLQSLAAQLQRQDQRVRQTGKDDPEDAGGGDSVNKDAQAPSATAPPATQEAQQTTSTTPAAEPSTTSSTTTSSSPALSSSSTTAEIPAAPNASSSSSSADGLRPDGEIAKLKAENEKMRKQLQALAARVSGSSPGGHSAAKAGQHGKCGKKPGGCGGGCSKHGGCGGGCGKRDKPPCKKGCGGGQPKQPCPCQQKNGACQKKPKPCEGGAKSGGCKDEDDKTVNIVVTIIEEKVEPCASGGSSCDGGSKPPQSPCEGGAAAAPAPAPAAPCSSASCDGKAAPCDAPAAAPAPTPCSSSQGPCPAPPPPPPQASAPAPSPCSSASCDDKPGPCDASAAAPTPCSSGQSPCPAAAPSPPQSSAPAGAPAGPSASAKPVSADPAGADSAEKTPPKPAASQAAPQAAPPSAPCPSCANASPSGQKPPGQASDPSLAQGADSQVQQRSASSSTAAPLEASKTPSAGENATDHTTGSRDLGDARGSGNTDAALSVVQKAQALAQRQEAIRRSLKLKKSDISRSQAEKKQAARKQAQHGRDQARRSHHVEQKPPPKEDQSVKQAPAVPSANGRAGDRGADEKRRLHSGGADDASRAENAVANASSHQDLLQERSKVEGSSAGDVPSAAPMGSNQTGSSLREGVGFAEDRLAKEKAADSAPAGALTSSSSASRELSSEAAGVGDAGGAGAASETKTPALPAPPLPPPLGAPPASPAEAPRQSSSVAPAASLQQGGGLAAEHQAAAASRAAGAAGANAAQVAMLMQRGKPVIPGKFLEAGAIGQAIGKATAAAAESAYREAEIQARLKEDQHGAEHFVEDLIDKEAEKLQQKSPTLVSFARTDGCIGWAPEAGTWRGMGAVCGKWDSSWSWCYVDRSYNGRWLDFMRPSKEYEGKLFAPCGDGDHMADPRDILLQLQSESDSDSTLLDAQPEVVLPPLPPPSIPPPEDVLPRSLTTAADVQAAISLPAAALALQEATLRASVEAALGG